MADWTDEASEISEIHHQKAIESRVRYQGVSEKNCLECDTDIPEARQIAIPGVKLCVDCQQLKEMGKL